MVEGERTYFLTLVIWHVMLVFYGESQEWGNNRARRTDPTTLRRLNERLPRGNGSQKRRAPLCFSRARRPPSRSSGALACPKCKAIGGDVFYCSKEFQAVDWKSGKPPHKTISGKKRAIAAAFASAPRASLQPQSGDGDDFAPPSPGYTRSPALLYQLQLLKQDPKLDYVYIHPDPLAPEGLSMYVVDRLCECFKPSMRRAVCDHSPHDVYRMFQHLAPAARDLPRFGVAGLKKQFFKEYGVDVDSATFAETDIFLLLAIFILISVVLLQVRPSLCSLILDAC
ncbi:hypothetical protein B0H19DRAFT_95395 [Mycena capillaripes]|nr:hypothetical protein B0H19DRAFT_95395 [Mycena capillaripes]